MLVGGYPKCVGWTGGCVGWRVPLSVLVGGKRLLLENDPGLISVALNVVFATNLSYLEYNDFDAEVGTSVNQQPLFPMTGLGNILPTN